MWLLVYKGRLFDVDLTQLNRQLKHLFLLAQKYIHVFLVPTLCCSCLYTIKSTIQTFISSSSGSISLLSYFLLLLQGDILTGEEGTKCFCQPTNSLLCCQLFYNIISIKSKMFHDCTSVVALTIFSYMSWHVYEFTLCTNVAYKLARDHCLYMLTWSLP